MIRFKTFKNEILSRAKEQGACKTEYARALKAQTFEELMGVIKDNFEWVVTHKIIDEELVGEYRKEFSENDIVWNKDLYRGFLLVTGNAEVVAHGNVTGIYGGYWKGFCPTRVYAYDYSIVIAHEDTVVKAFNRAKVHAYDNAKVDAYGNNVKVIDKRPSPEPSNPTPEKEEKEPTELDIAEFLLHELVELLKKLGLFEKLAAYYREKHTNTHP